MFFTAGVACVSPVFGLFLKHVTAVSHSIPDEIIWTQGNCKIVNGNYNKSNTYLYPVTDANLSCLINYNSFVNNKVI